MSRQDHSRPRPGAASPGRPSAASRVRRDLSLAEIVERATVILRDVGEPGLTMRQVAAACGVTPMAIYHHVTDKGALLGLVLDRVIEDAFVSADTDDWAADLSAFAARFRGVFLANPGAGRIFVARPVVGPGTARTTEELFRLLARGGFSPDAIARAADAIVLLVMGSIVNDLTRPPGVREGLLGVLPESETPHLRRSMPDYAPRDPEVRFRDALAWLLRGLEQTLLAPDGGPGSLGR